MKTLSPAPHAPGAAVVEALPAAQKQAVGLAFFHGMSQREIAALANTSLGTINIRLESGLKRLGDGMKDLKDEL